MRFGKIGCAPMMKKWTARDYVQYGLVAMWDGIENAGWGVHDANATVWKNLVGHDYDLYLNTNRSSFENDALVAVPYPENASSKSQWGAASYTSPINFGARFSGYEIVFSVDKSTPFDIMSPGGTGEKVTDWGYKRFLCNGQRIQTVTTTSAESPEGWCFDIPVEYQFKKFSFSWGFLGRNSYRNAFNGQIVDKTSSIKTSGYYESQYISLFGRYPVTDYGGHGKIYCLRFYSRALTADEIAANYAVDKKRFNLP